MNALTTKPHCFRSVSRTPDPEEAERSIGIFKHKYTEHSVCSGI